MKWYKTSAKGLGSEDKGVIDNLGYDVLIATYNGEQFIDEQLESIFSQTVKPNNIIIRDDCSSDSTLQIIHKYSKFDNVTIISGEKNLGYIKNFEALIAFATSPIIFFCDQDDRWDKDKAKLILEKFNTSQSDVVFTNAYVVNSQLQGTQNLWESIGFSGDLPISVGDYLYSGNVVTGATMACKLNFIKENLPFPKSIPHDYWIAINSILKNSLLPFDRKLIQYRQHEKNAIGVNQDKGLTKFISKFLLSSVLKRKEDAFEKSKVYVHIALKARNDKSLSSNRLRSLFFVYGCMPSSNTFKRENSKSIIIHIIEKPVLLYDFILVRLLGGKFT